MLNVLVPIDGSANGLNALRHAIGACRRDRELRLHLLNVQPTLSRHVARFVARRNREAWHREQAEAALAPARALLDRAGVAYQAQWCVGERVAAICQTAERLKCHRIVMGTARKNALTRLLEDSVTNDVLEHAPVPVEVVAGAQASRLERWGLPLGMGVGLSAMVWAALE
jgi:nucleotide-binding universal stress UspA family protein